MKKIIILSIIITAVITAAFVSKPKPPSFVVATAQAHDYLISKGDLLSQSSGKQDSIDIFNGIADYINDFNAHWNINEELQRGPVFPYGFACQYQCSLNYINQPFVPHFPEGELGNFPPSSWMIFQNCIHNCH
jgi:hypothetical protein